MVDDSKVEQQVVQDNMFGDPTPVRVKAVDILPPVPQKKPVIIKWADPEDIERPMEAVVGPGGIGSERLKK